MVPHPFMPDHAWGSPWWTVAHIVGTTASLLLWLTLIGLAVWAVIQLTPRREQPARVAAPSALELLCQRYVRGEIDAITFEEMAERIMTSEVWERTSVSRRGEVRSPGAD